MPFKKFKIKTKREKHRPPYCFRHEKFAFAEMWRQLALFICVQTDISCDFWFASITMPQLERATFYLRYSFNHRFVSSIFIFFFSILHISSNAWIYSTIQHKKHCPDVKMWTCKCNQKLKSTMWECQAQGCQQNFMVFCFFAFSYSV